jgi:hypothetical protein
MPLLVLLLFNGTLVSLSINTSYYFFLFFCSLVPLFVLLLLASTLVPLRVEASLDFAIHWHLS